MQTIGFSLVVQWSSYSMDLQIYTVELIVYFAKKKENKSTNV